MNSKKIENKENLTAEGLPKVTKETIKKHIKIINQGKKSGSFKSSSNQIFEEVITDNPELNLIIKSTLEDPKKSEDWKAGYLSGFTTLYDILKKQTQENNK